MRPHEREICPKVRKFLPAIPWHFADQRPFSVHHLVVTERQDEILGESVNETESQIIVVVRAVDRLARYVGECIVHPSHVPLVAKAKTFEFDWPRDLRPGSRLLCDRDRSRNIAVNALV